MVEQGQQQMMSEFYVESEERSGCIVRLAGYKNFVGE